MNVHHGLLLTAVALALACGREALAPSCPPGLQEWGYSRTDSAGRVVVQVSGCATPAAIDSMMARCLAGACGPL